MQIQIKLGEIFTKDNKDYRVVRLVENDTSFFETSVETFVVKTSYAMLKDEFGKIEFHVFYEQKIPTTPLAPTEVIRGLDPAVWRTASK